MIELSSSLLLVRTLQPGQRDDRLGAGFDPAAGGPSLPSGWEGYAQGDTGWFELVPPSGFHVAAYRANDDGTRGLFALFGRAVELDAIDQASTLAMPAREAWRRRAEPAVLQFLRYWPTYRCQGFERVADRDGGSSVFAFDGVRRLVDEGGQLPDYTVNALPWNLAADGSLTTQALARFRITSIDRPALSISLASLGCFGLFENEPDPGA